MNFAGKHDFRLGFAPHLHNPTTLPPLVVSALPRLIRHTTYLHKPPFNPPFLASSTPATYAISPSTTVSTLRPVIKSDNQRIKITTSVPENFHVKVSSHGNDEISVDAFPLPPIPTFSPSKPDQKATPTAVPIITVTSTPKPIIRFGADKTSPPFFQEGRSQIAIPSDIVSKNVPTTPIHLRKYLAALTKNVEFHHAFLQLLQ